MEALTLIDTIVNDWKIIVAAFTIGGFYFQSKLWFERITTILENSGKVHGEQNNSLDNINKKLESLDDRMAKIEDAVETVKNDNQSQAIKIAVLESQNNVIEHPVKRRIRRSH